MANMMHLVSCIVYIANITVPTQLVDEPVTVKVDSNHFQALAVTQKLIDSLTMSAMIRLVSGIL